MTYPMPTGWAPSRIINPITYSGGANDYYGADPNDLAAFMDSAGGAGGQTSLMTPITLPPEFRNPEIAARVRADMLSRGIDPGPEGTLDPYRVQEYGTSLFNDPSWADNPANIAAIVMGGAALGGAFGAGAAGAGGGGAAGATTSAGAGALTGVTLPSAAVPYGTTAALTTGAPAALVGGATAAGAASAAGIGGGAILNNLPAIISGASSLIGGKLASDAAEDASEAMLQANREALDYQRESRDIALGLIEPERQSANAAMARMLQMQGLPIPASLQTALDESGVTLGEFNVADTPGYRFRLKEAMDALETSAFARGGGMAGGFGEYALRYAQDYASTEYANIYNQLGMLAGRNTSSGGANVALNFGGNAAAITQDSGAARASGYVAQSNAWQNALDQIAQLPWDQWFPGRNRQGALAYGG